MTAPEITKLLENVVKPISQIEKQIGMPVTTLQKAIKGERTLPKKWWLALKDYVAKKRYLVGNPSKTTETVQKSHNDQQEEEVVEKETTGKEMPKTLSRTEQMRWIRENP